MARKLKRLLALALTLCFLVPALASSLTMRGEATADSLTIKVRYWGLAEVTKGTYSVGEVEGMGLTSGLYTANTNGGFLAYNYAEGVPISNILYAAGVNVGALKYCNFIASDGHNAGKDFYYGELFGAGYAYPDASLYYEEGVGFTDVDAVMASAVTVYPMLAIRDSYARVTGGTEYIPGAMSNVHCFRLMIGQQYPGHVMASDTIYDINTIIVTYNGSPEIIASDEMNITLGEDSVLEVSVSSADSDLTEIVAGGLKFRSSDPTVVSVDASGKLTAHSKGEVEIEVYYEATDIDGTGVSKTVRVVVGDGTGGSGGEGEGTGSGGGGTQGGTGTGDGGSGSTDGSGEGDGDSGSAPTEAPSTDTPATDNPGSETTPTEPVTAPTDSPNTPAPTEVPEETAAATEAPAATEEPEDEEQEEILLSNNGTDDLDPGAPDTSALQVRRVIAAGSRQGEASGQQGGAAAGADGGSAAMTLELETDPMLLIAGITAIVLFLAGGAGMYVLYRKEI